MAPRLVSGGHEWENLHYDVAAQVESASSAQLVNGRGKQPADSPPWSNLLALRNNPPKYCPGCITQDNDPRLIYTGNWALNVNVNNDKPFGTTHSTTARGASVLFSFNGTKVVVFGTVPQGNPQTNGPTAQYTLDGVSNFTTTLPVSLQQTRNQAFFAAHDLNTSIHTLEIQILQVNPKTPYILQYFFVSPHNMTGQDALDNSDPTTGPDQTSSAADPLHIVKILSGVLGAVLALIIVSLVLVFLRRQHFKSRSSGQIWSKFWKYSSPQVPHTARPETMFTSFTTPDSIMRNDPVSLARGSSAYTRSDGRSDFLRASASVVGPSGHFIVSSSKSNGR